MSDTEQEEKIKEVKGILKWYMLLGARLSIPESRQLLAEAIVKELEDDDG